MYIKLTAIAFVFFLFSCKDTDKNSTTNNQSTTTTDGSSSGDVEAQKKALNEQSRACIAIMNAVEEQMNAANAAGDTQTASAFKATMDSAATENAKIGQKLMALAK
jgi:hypothetical protein